jgi:hypothetical protein
VWEVTARLAGLALVVLVASPAAGEAERAAGAPTVAAGATGSAPQVTPRRDDEITLNAVADDYVRLVLAAGRHDAQFLDGFCGPASWRAEAEQGPPIALAILRSRARALLARLRALPVSPRRTFLERQLAAVEGFLLRLSGQPMSLGEEARTLFDIEPLPVPREELEQARGKLDEVVTGDRSLPFRVNLLRKELRVPREKLPAVLDAALALLRTRTAAIVTLPAGERVQVAYVTGKPWLAHASYQGHLTTLIEVDTDLPIELADVLDIAAREGYPGRHVFNVLRDAELAQGKGWREYTVQPVYSSETAIAEGAAAVALDVVMDRAARRTVMHDVLTPLAGLKTYDLDEYLDYREAARPLGTADDIAVRMLLDEGRPDSEVEAYLVQFALRSPAEAKRSLESYRACRSLVLARSAGEALVSAWIGRGPDRAARFVELLRRPTVPSELSSEH